MKTRHFAFGLAAVAAAGAAKVYALTVRGALTLDTGIGRRTRPLGPIEVQIAADPETVFDVIAAPYLGKTPHAMHAKLRVIERGTDMVLAEHFTDVGRGETAVTVGTVRFERPHTISFRLVRGPVPHVTETFDIQPIGTGTTFTYSGTMGCDLWALGAWWADQVAEKWEKTVETSLTSVREEAERLAVKSRRSAKNANAATDPDRNALDE
jgi:Polyketide cyclase / dehydrase and lipid transport